MKKLWIILLTISGLITILIFTLPYLNGKNRYFNYLNYLIYDNELDVSCDKQLDKNKIEIVFENEVALIQNRDSSEANRLLQEPHYKLVRETIFKNGKQQTDIPYDYGKQRLTVFYKKERIGELGHWRTNSYHIHRYKINLQSTDNKIILTGGIFGPDNTINYVKQ